MSTYGGFPIPPGIEIPTDLDDIPTTFNGFPIPPGALGGGGPSSSSGLDGGGGGGFTFDPILLAPPPGRSEEHVALAKFVIMCVVEALGWCVFLPYLYKERLLFDLRIRSPHLQLLCGASALAALFTITFWFTAPILFGYEARLDIVQVVLFMQVATFYGAYIARGFRLLVKTREWLRTRVPVAVIRERNIVIVLVVLAVGVLGPIPVLYNPTGLGRSALLAPDPNFDLLENLVYASCGVMLLIFPFLLKVKDIYSVSAEMLTVTAAVSSAALLSRLLSEKATEAIEDFNLDSDWITAAKWGVYSGNVLFAMYTFVFFLSNMLPLIRLRNKSLTPSSRLRKVIGRCLRCRLGKKRNLSIKDSHARGDEDSELDLAEENFKLDTECWGSWKAVRDEPGLEEPFRIFVDRALCSESLRFLRAVDAYRANFDNDAEGGWRETDHLGDAISLGTFNTGTTTDTSASQAAAAHALVLTQQSSWRRAHGGGGGGGRGGGGGGLLVQSAGLVGTVGGSGTTLTIGGDNIHISGPGITAPAATVRVGTGREASGGVDLERGHRERRSHRVVDWQQQLRLQQWAEEQKALFSKLVSTYVVTNAPYEINIAHQDRKVLVAQGARFAQLHSAARKAVFDIAYRKVETLVNENLIVRFLLSQDFARVRDSVYAASAERLGLHWDRDGRVEHQRMPQTDSGSSMEEGKPDPDLDESFESVVDGLEDEEDEDEALELRQEDRKGASGFARSVRAKWQAVLPINVRPLAPTTPKSGKDGKNVVLMTDLVGKDKEGRKAKAGIRRADSSGTGASAGSGTVGDGLGHVKLYPNHAHHDIMLHRPGHGGERGGVEEELDIDDGHDSEDEVSISASSVSLPTHETHGMSEGEAPLSDSVDSSRHTHSHARLPRLEGGVGGSTSTSSRDSGLQATSTSSRDSGFSCSNFSALSELYPSPSEVYPHPPSDGGGADTMPPVTTSRE